MKPKSLEIFIPGPAGRLEAKYYKNPKFGSPVAIVLHPHPQYGGTMNNPIVMDLFSIFDSLGFSIFRFFGFLSNFWKFGARMWTPGGFGGRFHQFSAPKNPWVRF